MISRRYQLIFVIPLEIRFDWMRSFWFCCVMTMPFRRPLHSDVVSIANEMVLICNFEGIAARIDNLMGNDGATGHKCYIYYILLHGLRQSFSICVGRYLAGK